MTQKISRRDFLKLAGVGAAASAALTGCGPASKYVTRQPYFKMPEYTYNGESAFYATACRECAAACGLVVRTMQGRALKVEGNKANPVNLGKTCARGQTTLQGLYNPDRVTGPTKQGRAAKLGAPGLAWDAAVATVADTLKKYKPSEIAFLMGTAPDHLFDLASELAAAIDAPAPIRFGALSMFEGRATLAQAAQEMFGQPALPFFDLASADVVVSFGANFLETWVSPVAYTRGYSKLRKGQDGKRGYFVQFETRMSQTGAVADEWISLRPGTEGLVALALGRLLAEARGGAMPKAFASVDAGLAAGKAGVSLEALQSIAARMAAARSPLAVIGGPALAHSNGLENAKSVYAFNSLSSSFFLSPLAPGEDAYHRPASAHEMREFVKTLDTGKVKALFIHGVNPAFELPKSWKFADALKNVETVVSFATFPDETALLADYILPDHHGLESFGYQRAYTGASASVLSGMQPVVNPFVDTKATADVLLAAAAQAGFALPYADEYEYVKAKLQQFVPIAGGNFAAPEINTFMAYFQQHGGWWKDGGALAAPTASNGALTLSEAEFEEGEFFLVPFVSPTLGEAGANKPWLQETADPTTTVMWNTWVEINPETAHELGLENDDVVKIVSAAGEVEAAVYKYPAIRPDTIAIPFGQGHTAYGQYAAGRGANPADLFGSSFNAAGDLCYADIKVRVEKTGRKLYLSRLESKIGVYGEGLGEGH